MLDIRIVRQIIYIVLASLGAILILINTWNYGIGLTDDSVNYIYSGYNLYKLKGLYGYDGSVFINWPPLYSIVIFLISIFSSDINLVMTIFNSLLYFITIILIGKLSEHIFTTSSIKIIYTAALAFSYQMLFVFVRVWSETVFTTLLVLSLLLIVKNNSTKRDTFVLITLSLCLLTRYSGISIIITYFIYKVFLETNPDNRGKNGYLKILLLSLLTIIPALIWLVRNKILAGNITGLEFNSFETILKSFFQLLSSISSLFIPESLNVNFRIILFLLLLSALIVISIKHRVENRHSKLLFLLSVVYICVLLIVSGILKFDGLSQRFVLPLYFVLLLILIYPFDYLINKSGNKITKVILFSLLILIIAFPVEKGLKHTYINFTNGIEGFNSKEWKDSQTIKLIKKDFRGSEIYSNSVAGIYANTGLKTKRISNYSKDSTGEAVLILFNNHLPAIDSIPELKNIISENDSTLNYNDSYIIIKNSRK